MQIILLIISTLIIAFFVMRSVAMAKLKNTPLVSDHQDVLTLTDQNFKQKTKGKVVLVDFLGNMVRAMPNDGAGFKRCGFGIEW